MKTLIILGIITSIVLPAILTIAYNIRVNRRKRKAEPPKKIIRVEPSMQISTQENKENVVQILPYDPKFQKKPFYWARPPIGYTKRENISSISELVPHAHDSNNIYILSGINGHVDIKVWFLGHTDIFRNRPRQYHFYLFQKQEAEFLSEDEVLKHIFKK